jgi:hypothetical protein
LAQGRTIVKPCVLRRCLWLLVALAAAPAAFARPAQGTDIVGLSPKEFGKLIDRELAQNSKVIKAVGMRADRNRGGWK